MDLTLNGSIRHDWTLAELGRSCSAPQYLATRDFLDAYTRRMATWWAGGFDLLLTPTLTQPPPALGYFAGDTRPTLESRAAADLTLSPSTALRLSWTQRARRAETALSFNVYL